MGGRHPGTTGWAGGLEAIPCGSRVGSRGPATPAGLVHLRGLLGNAGRTSGWQLASLPESAPKMTA